MFSAIIAPTAVITRSILPNREGFLEILGGISLMGFLKTGELTQINIGGKILPQSNQGPIAQLGARLNGIEKVEGSNPSGSTST